MSIELSKLRLSNVLDIYVGMFCGSELRYPSYGVRFRLLGGLFSFHCLMEYATPPCQGESTWRGTMLCSHWT
jgi:hypothetical protein